MGSVSGVKFRNLSDEQRQDNQERRTTGKCRGEKAGSHDSGQPEMSAGDTGIQESGHGMDADSPWYRKVNQGFYPFGGLYPFTLCAQALSSRSPG